MVAYVRKTLSYFSGLFVLFILTVNSAYEPKSIWTYFTSWNLALQYFGYVSALDNPNKRIILLDLAALVSWTVAVSYSVVIGVSNHTLSTLHELYGIAPFWIGNGLLHYIPPFLYTASIRTATDKFENRLISLLILIVLIVIYTVSHDTREIYMSDKIGKYEGMAYMIAASVALTPIVLDLGYINAFFWLWPDNEQKQIN